MDAAESLLDLCDKYGFDAIDSEVEVWIETGAFDYTVMERARVLDDNESPAAERAQRIHRFTHSDGPWHYTHCALCTDLWSI